MHIRFVFASSDQVFDGDNAPYDESSPPSPINIYGEQKAEAERLVTDRHPTAVVCRMPLMYGDPSPSTGSFIQPFIASLLSGNTISLFVDEYRTVAGAPSAARGLLLAAGLDGGLLHLGGKERLSRYEFGLRLATAIGADISLVKPCSRHDVPMPAPRPADVSMDSSKAFALGYDPLTVDEELAGLRCVREGERTG
jgi:dTDP-4-dehydrorhamnose reductase